MTLPIAFHAAAAPALGAAAACYEAEGPGRGACVLAEVEAALQGLGQLPEGGIRRTILLRAPLLPPDRADPHSHRCA